MWQPTLHLPITKIGASAHSSGPALLSTLTSLTNIILQGKVPRVVRPFFFGASLIAVLKLMPLVPMVSAVGGVREGTHATLL